MPLCGGEFVIRDPLTAECHRLTIRRSLVSA